MRGRQPEIKPPIVVAYKKRGKAVYLKVFENIELDLILSIGKNPLLPVNWEILDIGLGRSFIDRYKQKYDINDEP
jgi:hypothetical protein